VAHAARAIVNTAPIRWHMRAVVRAAWIAIANQVEAAELCGRDNPKEAARHLGSTIGIVTLGAEGSILATSDCIRHLPAPAVVAIDTTGAGDVFCGVLAARLAGGCDVLSAVIAAQHAAALSVTRPGCFAAIPTTAELSDQAATF
jgi:ribokinase